MEEIDIEYIIDDLNTVITDLEYGDITRNDNIKRLNSIKESLKDLIKLLPEDE